MSAHTTADQSIGATVRHGQVHMDDPTDWPEGTRVTVTAVLPLEEREPIDGHVLIVGFGLAGRCVADLLDRAGRSYTIVEKNPVTVATQSALGRDIRHSDILDAQTLTEAGLPAAAILALTIPDEEAVLAATALARQINPEIYIIARTNYSSKGMRASQLGADEVIKAEQAVAVQFYDKLSQRIVRTG